MKRPSLARVATALGLIAALALPSRPALATCGGGGGGGMGGATAGGPGRMPIESYHVPWTFVGVNDVVPGGALAIYWFPSSASEARDSDLRTSRALTLASARCIGMAMVTPENQPLRDKYKIPDRASSFVLVDAAGTEIARVQPGAGPVPSGPAERLVTDEIDRRDDAAKTLLDQAKEKEKAKDVDGAVALYRQVWAEQCLVPGPAKKAAKALKKLGQPVDESSLGTGDTPILAGAKATEVLRTMNAGLAAERAGRIDDAKRLYAAARRIDPADPVPVRFLGELARHETGDWNEARALFDQVLAMNPDVVSKAVALHGLGKMTIHDGRFADGLALFQRSLDAYPLALTYRNLAVYWNSEKDHVKAHAYVRKALMLDPDDEYNRIFAATYFVELGRPDEAREVALKYEALLPASYNLAVIHAQLGDREKALALLNRHFTVYEQFDAVRRKEMQEARDDVAFASLRSDPVFIEMTAMADSDGNSYHRNSR